MNEDIKLSKIDAAMNEFPAAALKDTSFGKFSKLKVRNSESDSGISTSISFVNKLTSDKYIIAVSISAINTASDSGECTDAAAQDVLTLKAVVKSFLSKIHENI